MVTYPIVGAIIAVVLVVCWLWFRNTKKKLNDKNKELESQYKESEKQTQSQQEFITSLSKELRTPLYGIMGLTNLVAEEYPDIKNNGNFKSLKFSGDHLLKLINNVLQVSYLDKEEIETSDIDFNLKETTQNLVSSFNYATKNSDNTLHFEFDKDINPMVNGDPAILAQILINLISNALRFTQNGNIYFSVDLIKKKDNANRLSFKVKHDGNEITAEDEKSIYKEFINVETSKRSYLGTGLNSTIVNKLASALHGEIIKQNEGASGTSYALVADFKTLDSNKTEKEVEKVESKPKPEKPRVLIVDDNKLNLLVADKMLSNENFECTTVDNGFDAIDLAKENDYEIILMDINMPQLNGIGATKRIREFDKNTPVIALTAVDVTQLNRQILQAGFNDYILKPYDKSHLLELIQNFI